ncbi:MAG: deoxyuridine 5'-triphosphate nucleotidohydrolase [Firmicutes bacterium]|nr:deoxyuridine 5'-triphosphate nucleotidohydrolase [Bacillota bacterium]
MGRFFEKISFEQFKKDICDDKNAYDNLKLPTRSTKHSAGYDFKAVYDFVIHPGEVMKVPTGVKVSMEPDEVFMIFVRSSMGVKHGVRMANSVGIIDSDYYNNDNNEGHMYITLKNESDKDYIVQKNEGFGQGIFTKFLMVDREEEITSDRKGGFGSTNQEEK